MKTLLLTTAMLSILVSCSAPVAKEAPKEGAAPALRCAECGRTVSNPKDFRGGMCSLCDWRVGNAIGWP